MAYAARVAEAWGVRAQVLAAADAGADLRPVAAHELQRVDCGPTLRFTHLPAPGGQGERELRLASGPGRPLGAADLPAAWPPATLLLLGPLVPGDMDVPALIAASGAAAVALLGQGLQRRVAGGRVHSAAAPTAELHAALAAAPRTSLFLSEAEVAPWPPAALHAVAAAAGRLVVTRGAAGVDLYRDGRREHVPAHTAPGPGPLDTTGAGDVFATAFILAVTEAADGDDAAAARIAARVAAASLAVAGPGPLPDLRPRGRPGNPGAG